MGKPNSVRGEACQHTYKKKSVRHVTWNTPFFNECKSNIINSKCPNRFPYFLLPQCTYDTRITIALRNNLPTFRRTPSFYNVIHEDAIWHWTEEDDDAISHNPLEDSSLHHHNHLWILPDVARTEKGGGREKTHRRNEAEEKNKKAVNCEDLFTAGSRYLISSHNGSAQLGHQIFSYRMMYGRPDWLDNLLEGW